MNIDYQKLNEVHLISSQAGITSLSFDGYEELLWSGTEYGRIDSHSSKWNRHTSFFTHQSPITQIVSTKKGIYSIGSNILKHSSRNGLAKFSYSLPVPHLTGLSLGSNDVLVSGGGFLFSINPFTGLIMNQHDIQDDIITFKRSHDYLIGGSVSGKLIMMDPRTLKIQSRIHAHSFTVCSIDTYSNYLVSCGYAASNGAMNVEPMIKVFDTRTMKSLAPISFPSGPCFVKFHPKMSSTLYACSHSGEIQISDILKSQNQFKFIVIVIIKRFYQVGSSGYCSAFDFSSSGETFAVGDNLGVIHIFSANDSPKINPYSIPFETAEPFNPENVIYLQDDAPLNSIGMPYYSTTLLSAWPNNLKTSPGKQRPQIPNEILENVKKIDFVGYAPNSTMIKRNQNLAKQLKPKQGRFEEPKFRSEQQREKYNNFTTKRNESQSELDCSSSNESSTSIYVDGLSRYHRRVEIKYSRFGVEDFDFDYYNKTRFSGLETHIENSYCNPLLQVLFFTQSLRQACKRHIKLSCLKEFCITCEMGFLFRMLEDSKGANCQATNFLGAFSHIPQASALGLISLDENKRASNSKLIQNLNR